MALMAAYFELVREARRAIRPVMFVVGRFVLKWASERRGGKGSPIR